MCSRPSQVRRSAFTRSPLRNSSSAKPHSPTTPSDKFSSPVGNFSKTSGTRGSGSLATSSKKRSSVNKTTPRSSRSTISADASVATKSTDHLSARVSAAEQQKNFTSSKSKIAARQSHQGVVVDPTQCSSHKTSETSKKTPRSGRTGVNRAKKQSNTDHSELKGKDSNEESSTAVVSAREKKMSNKQPVSARGESRPASRLHVYVCLIGKCISVTAVVDNVHTVVRIFLAVN